MGRRYRNPFAKRRRQSSESVSQQIARLRREIMNEQGNMNNGRTKIEQQTETIKQLQIKLDALLASGGTAVSVQSEMSDCNTNLAQAKNDLSNSTNRIQGLIVQLAQKQAQYDELIRKTQLTDIELSTATININNLNKYK